MTKQDNEGEKNFKGRILNEKYKKFSSTFADYNIEYKTFVNKFPGIIENIKSLGKRSPSIKHEILSLFGSHSWKNLSEEIKSKHTFSDCKGCLQDEKYKNGLAELPIKKSCAKFKAKAKQYGLIKPKILADITTKIVNDLDQEYNEKYNTTFSKQIQLNSERKKPTADSSIARKTIQNVEKQWKETAVERYI